MSFTPKRPYLIRAMHEWLEDNELTAYLMIDATHADVVAPLEYATDGRLVLATSYQATKDLHISNDAISFAARFGGVSQDVWIPMPAVLGIYAKESPNEGHFFDPNEYANIDIMPKTDPKQPSKHSGLKFVD